MQILGDEKLDRALLDLEKKTERKYIMKAMREAFKIVHRESKTKVPHGTGRLKRSIKLRKRKPTKARGGGKWVGMRIFTGGREDLGIREAARPGLRGGKGTGYYPFALEAGYTRPDGVRVEARSYLREPLKRNRDRVFRKIRVLLWRQIKGAASK